MPYGPYLVAYALWPIPYGLCLVVHALWPRLGVHQIRVRRNVRSNIRYNFRMFDEVFDGMFDGMQCVGGGAAASDCKRETRIDLRARASTPAIQRAEVIQPSP